GHTRSITMKVQLKSEDAPATELELERLRRAIGFEPPSDYVDFLSSRNGCRVELKRTCSASMKPTIRESMPSLMLAGFSLRRLLWVAGFRGMRGRSPTPKAATMSACDG